MNPNLARISEKAKAHPTLVCTSLSHHIADIEHLRACYQLLKGNKAVGVDEVTKSMDAEDLEANLQDLSARLKRMGYQPQPKRRIDMPKPGSETGQTPPDLVVNFQPIDLVDVILWLVLRPCVVYQWNIKG